jgi:predicted DNA-binding transcriptional regulator AlpA
MPKSLSPEAPQERVFQALISQEQICSILQIKGRTLRDWRASGDFPEGLKIGRNWFIRRGEFDAWLNRKSKGNANAGH